MPDDERMTDNARSSLRDNTNRERFGLPRRSEDGAVEHELKRELDVFKVRLADSEHRLEAGFRAEHSGHDPERRLSWRTARVGARMIFSTARPPESVTEVAVTPLAPERFREVLSAESLAQFERGIARAQGARRASALERQLHRRRGRRRGNAALASLVHARGRHRRPLGCDRRHADFFRVTKRIHNFLHGSPAMAVT